MCVCVWGGGGGGGGIKPQNCHDETNRCSVTMKNTLIWSITCATEIDKYPFSFDSVINRKDSETLYNICPQIFWLTLKYNGSTTNNFVSPAEMF